MDTKDPTLASYDRIAFQYAEALFDELSRKPFDRLLLDAFAARTRVHGEVWDIGCGPGHVGRYLHERGVSVCGLDLSERMIACARELNPVMPFRQGSMLALDTPADSLAGIVCFYAIIHLRRNEAVSALSEFWRTLQPGSPVLLAFHGGAGELHSIEMLGEPVDVTATLFEGDEMAGYASDAGFIDVDIQERPPYEFEYQSRRVYLLARKPGLPK
ncbi:MAG TPA: class I SAM-dependent methyltransferase [Ktedonobacterales bacterium]